MESVRAVCSSAGVRSHVSQLHDRARGRYGGSVVRGDRHPRSNTDLAQRRQGTHPVSSCLRITRQQSHHQEHSDRRRRHLLVSVQEPSRSSVARHQSCRQRSVVTECLSRVYSLLLSFLRFDTVNLSE